MDKPLQIAVAAGLLLGTECSVNQPEQTVRPEPTVEASFFDVPPLSPEVMRVLDENTVQLHAQLQAVEERTVEDLPPAELETAYFLEPFGVVRPLQRDGFEGVDDVPELHTEDLLLTRVEDQPMEWNVYEFLGKDEEGPVFKADTDGSYCSRLSADLEGYYDVNGTYFYAVKESNAGEFPCPPLNELTQQQ